MDESWLALDPLLVYRDLRHHTSELMKAMQLGCASPTVLLIERPLAAGPFKCAIIDNLNGGCARLR